MLCYVRTRSHGAGACSCLACPLPSASRFLCALNSRNSLRSSSDNAWQYRTWNVHKEDIHYIYGYIGPILKWFVFGCCKC